MALWPFRLGKDPSKHISAQRLEVARKNLEAARKRIEDLRQKGAPWPKDGYTGLPEVQSRV